MDGLARRMVFMTIAAALAVNGVAMAAENSELLIRRGVELRRQGKDAEAAELFRQAYVVSHSPRAAAQLGLCEQALGQLLEAEQHLSESLLAESDPWIASKRQTLEQSRSELRKKLSSVTITGGPPGSFVIVNEQAVGQMPLQDDVWVLPGTVVASARKDGFEPKRVAVEVAAGGRSTISLDLKPAGPLVQEAPSTSAPAPIESTAERDAGDIDRGSSFRTVATWGALGLGAASLGFGIFSHLRREAAVSDFNDPSGGCYETNGVVTGGSSCSDLDSDISSHTTGLIVGYVGAAAFLGVGAALWLTRPTDGGSLACTADLSPSNASPSVLCNGTF